MSKSIPVSPKYGVNPTIPICFWCGKEKNEIALLGKLKGDAEAPMHSVINYEPCEECSKAWHTGFALLGVTDVPLYKDLPPVNPKAEEKLYPSGKWMVVTENLIRGIFQPETAEEIIARGFGPMYIDDELVVRLNEMFEKLENESSEE